MRTPSPNVFRRVLAASAAVAVAALVATGCGGDGGDGGGGDTGLVGDEGPLAWLPADTWMVATANLDPKAIDTAVTSLDRLPIWALAEGFLPASDGTGLRRELLEFVAKSANEEEGVNGKLTAKELEAAFGNRVGMAITSTDFESFDGDAPPVVAWLEVDDEDAAEAVARDAAQGTVEEREHEGVEFLVDESGDGAILIQDELLFFASDAKQMEAIIDVHEGDDSLADDEVGAAVLEVGVGDALIGFAIASEPLLEAAPKLVRTQADDTKDDGEATREQKQNAERAAKIADELGPLLESRTVDDLIADWVSGSITIDETGLRLKGAWSNPRELATPEPGSRELVERGPADAQIVNSYVSDGTMLTRLQDAWAEVRDAYDLDLRALVAQECSQADRWACDLGIELALVVLEDDGLADALQDQGEVATALFQDIGPQVEALGTITETGRAPADNTSIESRLFEAVTTGSGLEGYAPPAELMRAATAAGLAVTYAPDGGAVTVRVKAGSPLARLVREEFNPSALAALAAVGFDLRQLLSPGGLVIEREEVDGLGVWGFPPNAPSKVVPALEGDADTLGDDATYRKVIAAAKPPKDVGAYGWTNLQSYVEATLAMVGQDAESGQDIQRIIPTVRNNLADVPGIVTWSTREESDGEDVGVFEMAVPILD